MERIENKLEEISQKVEQKVMKNRREKPTR